MSILVGTVLRGYCRGHFGRDSYGDKRVESVGMDWVVAREIDSGQAVFAKGRHIHHKLLEIQSPECLAAQGLHPEDEDR